MAAARERGSPLKRKVRESISLGPRVAGAGVVCSLWVGVIISGSAAVRRGLPSFRLARKPVVALRAVWYELRRGVTG
eukprot:3551420-Pleurochrysis_carterae.AAC.1